MFSAVVCMATTLALVGAGGGNVGVVRAAAEPAATGWSAPVTLAEEGFPVSAAMSADGDLAAVWQSERGPMLAIRPAAGSWGEPALVARHAGLATVAYNGAGDLVVAWGEHRPGQPSRVKVRVLTDSGWQAADILAERARGGVGVVDLAVNASGTTVVAWQWEVRNRLTGFVTRGTPAGAWTTGLRAARAFRLEVALGDRGDAAVLIQRVLVDPATSAARELTWEVARQAPGRSWGRLVVLQRLTDVGPPWPGPGGVHVDATGRTTVAWSQRVAARRWPVVAARAVPGRPWQRPVRLAHQSTWSEAPILVTGAQQGDVVVSFLREPLGDSLAVVRWGSPGWGSPVDVSGQVTYINDWDVAMDPSGAAVALWTPSRGPGNFGRGVLAALMAPDGMWVAPQRLTKAQTPDGRARVAAMNNGEAAALWSQLIGDTFGVRVRTHG